MKRWRIKLLLLCSSLAVALTTVEVGLRLAGFSRPYFYTFDEELGWDLRPDVSGWFRKEGGAYIHINSSGRRDDRQYTTTKPNDTFRIAIIGDSYAEAMQVPVAQTFWSVLERELGKCPVLSMRAEVLNFGVSSYGTAQELMMLRKHVWAFSPDVVLLAFASVNDVRNNSRQLEQDDLRPYFVFQNGELVADMSFRDSPRFRQKQSRLNQTIYRLINHSRLLQLINGVRDDLLTRRAISQGRYQGATTETAEIGVDDKVYQEPTDQAWKQAWQVTEALLSQMNKEVTARGAKFMVVTLTAGPQVRPDASGRQSYMARLGVTDLFYPERRIQAVAEREHFPILTLAPVFMEYANEHRVALHGFDNNLNLGHWNAEGHRLAGERISQRLCELIAADHSKTNQEEIAGDQGVTSMDTAHKRGN